MTTEYGVMSLPDRTVTPYPDRLAAGLAILNMGKPGPGQFVPLLVYRDSPDSEWHSVWTHRPPRMER